MLIKVFKDQFRNNLDLILAFLLFCMELFIVDPGFMSPDSVRQLNAAQNGIYTDWDPPFMSYVWRFINKIHFGPFGMVALHSLIFFAGVILLVRFVVRDASLRCMLLACLYLAPPVFTQLGVVWKDVALSVSYLLGCSILLYARDRPKWIFASCIPLFYGTAVRYNSFSALLPLCLWMGILLFPHRALKSIGAAVLLFMGLLGSAKVVNNELSKGHHLYVERYIQYHDLAGISLHAGFVVSPALPLTMDEISKLYKPAIGNLILNAIPTPLAPSILQTIWIQQIMAHPRAYLSHRWAGFRILLAISVPEVVLPYFDTFSENPWGFSFKRSFWVRMTYHVSWMVRNSFLFRGYVYVLCCLIFMCLNLFRRDGNLDIVFISASGLLYALGYFIYGAGADFRYLYWTVMAAGICMVLQLRSVFNLQR